MEKKKDKPNGVEPNERETFSSDGYPMAFVRGAHRVMKHVTLTCDKEQLSEALLNDKRIFGAYLSTQGCPICWGTGVVGDGEKMIFPGCLTATIKTETMRGCPHCKGSGVLALDEVTLTYYRIAVTGDASVEEKVKRLKKKCNKTTNQRKEQPWKR